jgi:DNA polymerase-3 subunit gamma/tau
MPGSGSGSQQPAPPQAPNVVAEPAPSPAAAAGPDAPVAEQPAGPRGGLSLVDVRRLWPDILEQTKNRRRLAWMVLSQHAHVVDVDGVRLTVGFANAGARDSFVNGGCDEILRQAAIDVVGMDWRVESIVDPSGAAAEAPVVRRAATDPAPSAAVATPSGPPGGPAQEAPDGPPSWVTGDAAPPSAPAAPPPVSAAPAREALEAARAGGPAEPAAPVRSADDDVDPDDPDADSAAIDTESLLSQTLGAKLIEEIRND